MNPPHGLPGDAHVGVLLSYWMFKQKRDLAADMGTTSPLCIDSGAFSAFTTGARIEVSDYAEWLDSINRPIDFAFNLDVLGDADRSLSNWRALRALGHDTMPVIHFGTPPEDVLPAYFAEGADRLSLGGIVGASNSKTGIGWTAHVFRWMRLNGFGHVPVHGLGLHMRSRLALMPWATTDSSTYVNLWRFGHFVLWTGRAWPMVWLDARDGKGVYYYGSAFRRLGVEPERLDVRAFRTDDPLACDVVVRIEDSAARDFARIRRLSNTPRRYLAANLSNYGVMARAIEALYSHEHHSPPLIGGNSGV